MELEDLRNIWKDTIRNGGEGGFSGRDLINLSRRTSLDRLLKYYRRFMLISFAMIAVSASFFRMDFFIGNWNVWLGTLFMLYFFVVGCMDLWLYLHVSVIDIYRMPVREVASIAIKCRRRHHQFMIGLIPFAIAAVYVLICASKKESVIIGAVIGGIIGGLIGYRKYREIMQDYRTLSEIDWDEEENQGSNSSIV